MNTASDERSFGTLGTTEKVIPAPLSRPGIWPSTLEVPDMQEPNRPAFPWELLPHADEIRAAIQAEAPPQRWRQYGPPDERLPLFGMESRAWLEWYRHRGLDPHKQREHIPASTRRAVISRDGNVCQLCQGDIEDGNIHLDHIVPVSHGGDNSIRNLQVAHAACNIAKGNRV